MVNKMIVRVANREYRDKTAASEQFGLICAVGLYCFGRQLLFEF